MGNRLFVGVLGHRKAGKSRTWNELFGREVRRGTKPRLLELRAGEFAEVYLISGSPEERREYAGKILRNVSAQIILCSIQYTEAVSRTVDYLVNSDFDVFVQWLNPGYHDSTAYFDRLGLTNRLLAGRAHLSVRNGSVRPYHRVQEIREFIYGWAVYRDLIV
jgi:hypothetical protein